jgi:hypothetical protein
VEIVKAKVLRPPSRYREYERTGRLSIREIDRDLDASIQIACVQNADGFVAGELAA